MEVVVTESIETYGMSRLGCRLLGRVIDSHIIVNERVTPIKKEDLWNESLTSKTFRERSQFEAAIQELKSVGLIQIVFIEGVEVVVPLGKLIDRYYGSRISALFLAK